ncbi:hypothetical protein [Massilia sp. CCM 8734]|uniref:hypothetical protein n=1 Tax=Massilia sp. CCM 8734 TaxID=2609283 RepID=UPI0014234433|nr:hypothetical protein [Massilia sp. CCM 8734]NIA00504.1 hypothetical protein [Massilia sp. CCM 8734]
MSYGYDYIVGNMKCAFCDSVSKADSCTNLQTKICVRAQLESYTIGSRLDLDTCIPDCGYVCLIQPTISSSFNFIDFWGCSACTRINGVNIELEESVIICMTCISPSDTVIEGVNYISDDYDLYGWGICGSVIHRGVVDLETGELMISDINLSEK